MLIYAEFVLHTTTMMIKYKIIATLWKFSYIVSYSSLLLIVLAWVASSIRFCFLSWDISRVISGGKYLSLEKEQA